MKGKRIYILGSILLTISIAISIFLIGILSTNLKRTSAADGYYTITVNRVSTVSVAISGSGVRLVSTHSQQDEYAVEEGTEITVRAISESRIFSEWQTTPSSNPLNGQTSECVTFTPTGDFSIEAKRRDPSSSDVGRYMSNAFVISQGLDLYNLQQAFIYGNNVNNSSVFKKRTQDNSYVNMTAIEYYGTLFGEDASWKQLETDAEKLAAINTTYFSRLQTGYFLVSQSFAYLNDGVNIQFNAIGTQNNKFKGVFSGAQNQASPSISIIIQDTQQSGNSYYGLFAYLPKEAVVRNINLQTSTGISTTNTTTTNEANVYVGGLAAILEGGILRNLSIQAKHYVHINGGHNINNSSQTLQYAFVGGIAGYMTSGIDHSSNVVTDNHTSAWIIQSTNDFAVLNVGQVAGYAKNAYVNELNSDTSEFTATVKCSTVNNNNKLVFKAYVGNLFGYYDSTGTTTNKRYIENIKFTGTSAEKLTVLTAAGDAYVAGLIGYVNAQNEILIGDIEFQCLNKNTESIFSATSVDANSRANLYSAGLFAYVTGYNLIAKDEFKDRIVQRVIDEKTYYRYKAIFNENVKIESVQNGKANANRTYGKAIAGGLVGYGYFNIAGTAEKHSKIALSLEDYNFSVIATQTSISTHESAANSVGDKEHCIASLIYGIISQSSVTSISNAIRNIDVYVDNAFINSKREYNSKSMGDVTASGFLGYANSITFTDINLNFNNVLIKTDSLSYDIQNSEQHSNNAYSSGFVGNLEYGSLVNVVLKGHNYTTHEDTGTTLKISAIQNTKPRGGDFGGENYVGGLCGRMTNSSFNGVKYIGSTTEEDYIQMQGHQSPDSSFAGGLVGMIEHPSSATIASFTNCYVSDARIYGSVTNTNTSYSNPDCYVGGILGAIYIPNSNSNTGLTINGCVVENSTIEAVGNELMEAFAGGLVGTICWSTATCSFSNSYVYNSNISASQYGNRSAGKSYTNAAGLASSVERCTLSIDNCGVFDTIVNSYSQNDRAYAFGIAYSHNSSSITCRYTYSNATLTASTGRSGSATNRHGIINTGTVTRCYYDKTRANHTSGGGTGLDFNSRRTVGNSAIGLFEDNTYGSLNSNDRGKTKYYPVLRSQNKFTVNYNNNSRISKIQNNVVDIADIWVNIKNGGSSTPPVNLNTIEELHNAGWFKMGQVVISNGTSSNDGTIQNIIVTYPTGSKEYRYDSDENLFINNLFPYDSTENIGYQIRNINETLKNNPVTSEIDINLFDQIPQLKISFSVIGNANQDLLLTVFDSNKTTEITNMISNRITSDNYGSGFLTYTMENVDGQDVCHYEFVYTPNSDYNTEKTFYLAFKYGTNSSYAPISFKINLNPNIWMLDSVYFTDYTKPLNYLDETAGTASNPYLLVRGSTTKFIPVITKSNDLESIKYDSELNVDFVTFTLSGNYGTIKANGEYVAGTTNNNNVHNISVVLKQGNQTPVVVYFKVVQSWQALYSAVGASVIGLTYATQNFDYILDFNCLEHYGGIPANFNVSINGVNHNQSDILNRGWIVDENDNVITEWNIDRAFYRLKVPANQINGNINISVEFQIIYTVSFNLMCTSFNPKYTGPQVLSFNILAGTAFNDFFNETIMATVNGFLNGALSTIDGYISTGFYLVEDANSFESYGTSFDEVRQTNLPINTSYTFYARWSFLIELIEAPGTHIQTSFASSFMVDIDHEELLRRTVSVPLNNNKGYVFTIVKDEGFVGEADVNAYVVTIDSGHSVVNEIAIEKYHENMYLYFIPPEKITGYLIIATSVSNSEFIVGEHSAKVTDEILPEDGIFTFKYVVNHKNTESEKSYLYKYTKLDPNRNLSLNKDLYIQFFDQIFDSNTMETSIEPMVLPIDSTIQVYYNLYINGSDKPSKSNVGIYKIDSNDVMNLKLSDFYEFNEQQKAFEVQTFQEAFGDATMISEVYYFVITPPNGYDSRESYEDYGHFKNCVVYVGYYDPLKNNPEDPYDKYIQGVRCDNEYANIPINEELIDNFEYESSRQGKAFTLTPSKYSHIDTNTNNTYTFKNYDDFTLVDLVISDGQILPSVDTISLFDSVEKNTVITSSEISNGILEMNLILGYGTGHVKVYGSTDGINFDEIKDIYVDDVEYKEYIVNFFDPSQGLETVYKYFRIDNVSLDEIRTKQISYADISYGMTYDINGNDCHFTDNVVNGDTLVYTVKKTIVENDRHNGKHFILAVQYQDGSNAIVENLPSVYISIDGDNYGAYENGISGRNCAYFDLTEILDTLGVDEITFSFVLPSGLTVKSALLIESKTIQKPAVSEVRQIVK